MNVQAGAPLSVEFKLEAGEPITLLSHKRIGVSVRCYRGGSLIWDGLLARRFWYGQPARLFVPRHADRIEFIDELGAVLTHEVKAGGSFVVR